MQTKNKHDVIDYSTIQALIAGLGALGFGSFALGLAVIGAEASPSIKNALNFYPPVGPLSGKTTFAVAVFFISWMLLKKIKHAESQLAFWLKLSGLLILIGLALTFPPIFMLAHH